MPLTIGVYPGFEEIYLEPGGTYEGTFWVINSGEDTDEPVDYRIAATPLTISSDGTTDYSIENDRTQISSWITFDKKFGTVTPGTRQEIKYFITVPEDAPVGGQYCAATVRIDQPRQDSEGVHVGAIYQVANLLYATVAGDLDFSGEVVSNTIHPIFLSSKITTAAAVRNTGNTHLDATSFIRVYEIFSDEEVYSSEEDIVTAKVIPGTTKTLINTWTGSPQLGIFRVIQTVSVADDVSTESSLVFVAPLWFLAIWFIFITSCIFWFIFRRKARKDSVHRSHDFTRPNVSR